MKKLLKEPPLPFLLLGALFALTVLAQAPQVVAKVPAAATTPKWVHAGRCTANHAGSTARLSCGPEMGGRGRCAAQGGVWETVDMVSDQGQP